MMARAKFIFGSLGPTSSPSPSHPVDVCYLTRHDPIYVLLIINLFTSQISQAEEMSKRLKEAVLCLQEAIQGISKM